MLGGDQRRLVRLPCIVPAPRENRGQEDYRLACDKIVA
jgi:hypothetical protein